MIIIRSVHALQAISLQAKAKRRKVGFVPTMGFLHEGHLSLFRRAKRECGLVIGSIFVNPTQFGPKEDFSKYPRNLKRDKALCREAGVDVLFLPDPREMYPDGYQTYVEPGVLAEPLCGRSRPGHFRGVTTIVAKLFNAALPDTSYFGQKDYQQAVVIRQMARDLDFPVRICICPIVRDRDGLALSSRNTYLDGQGRSKALTLSKSLKWAKAQIKSGRRDAHALEQGLRRMLSAGGVRVDYAEVVDAMNLSPVRAVFGRILIALAGYVPIPGSGQVRLIDNCLINVKSK